MILKNYRMSKIKRSAQVLFYKLKNKVCQISKKNIILKDKISHPNLKVTVFYKIKLLLAELKTTKKMKTK